MKTISFYSYKGGAGRTFTLANVGVYLARLGYKVVLLDFDFDAPGLPINFGLNPFEIDRPGVIDFMWRWLPVDEKVAPSSFEESSSIKEYCIPLWPPDTRKNDAEGTNVSGAGQLLLIPTGKPSQEGYWDHLSDRAWVDLYDMSMCGEKKIKLFFYDLKGAISHQLKADYLLIDARAGITRYGGASNLLLADRVACFIVNSPIGIAGTKQVFRALASAVEKRKQVKRDFGIPLSDFQVVPILARIPPLEDYLRSGLIGEIHDEFQGFADILQFPKQPPDLEQPSAPKQPPDLEQPSALKQPSYPHVLHSEWGVEIKEQLLLDLHGSSQNVNLSREILKLVNRLCPEVVEHLSGRPIPDNEQALKILWAKLGLPGSAEEVGESFKVFQMRRSPHDSRLIHLNDAARNVAFKVDTLRMILSHCVELVPSQAVPILESGGRKAGHLFGQTFAAASQDELITTKIDEWCEFDSNVGWGALRPDNLILDSRGRLIEGKIFVDDNFLAEGRTPDQLDLCGLFAGYIAGVIASLVGEEEDKVEVEHPLCMRTGNGNCVFSFVINYPNADEQHSAEETKSQPND